MAVLALVVYQDVKLRLIHILLPVAIFGLGIAINWDLMRFIHMDWISSLLFLALNLLVVTLYFSIKAKRYVNPFDALIGWGDIWFLIALVPLFHFRGYVQFFVMGMLFSLVLFIVMKSIYPKYKTIPLAGFLSIFLIGTTLAQHLTDIDILL